MEKDKIFFGETGITSTNANYVANLAKEAYESIENALNSMQFYGTTIDTAQGGHLILEEGNTDADLEKIPEMLNRMCQLKSLIAWLREAIKARTSLNNSLNSIDVDAWAKNNGIEIPSRPVMGHILTEDEYWGTIGIKQRNAYYTLETKCATIGKYIHPNGNFSSARSTMKTKSTKPHLVSGSGRDLTVYNYTVSVTPDKVEELFFNLQQIHRELQANLNSMKFECEKAIEESTTKANAEYASACAVCNAQVAEISAKYRKWMKEEQTKIGKLKIVIPDNLKTIFEEVSALGK